MVKEPEKWPVITPSIVRTSTAELLARTVDRVGCGWGANTKKEPHATDLSPVTLCREGKKTN